MKEMLKVVCKDLASGIFNTELFPVANYLTLPKYPAIEDLLNIPSLRDQWRCTGGQAERAESREPGESDNHAQVPIVFGAILEAVKAFPEMDRGCPTGTGQGRDKK